jgi:glycine hydroxymethyltransferase
LEAEASVLVNKNASGYPPRDSFGGSDTIDAIERLAIERAKSLFKAEYANVQALSSTIANVAVLRALLSPGDRILAFDQIAGGHVSHGGRRHISGQEYSIHSFGVRPGSEQIDYEAARRIAREFHPRMIVAGSSAYPYMIDFAALQEIAEDSGAMLFADLAHVAGLVVAGIHPNPVPHCDVATTSTHKTLCGPRTGGLILSKARYASALDTSLAPGLQAAPGAHIIAGRAVLFELVQRPAFSTLMRMVAANGRSLADRLRELGVPLYAGGTDTHMVVIDLRRSSWKERELNAHLLRHGIVANTTNLPRVSGGGGMLGLRVGSTAMTIRGADQSAFHAIADALSRLVSEPKESGNPLVREALLKLAEQHPIPFQ